MTSSPDQSHRADHEIRVLVGPVLDQIEGGATAPDVRNVRARSLNSVEKRSQV